MKPTITDTEDTVLGCIIQDCATFWALAQRHGMSADHFQTGSRRRLFEVVSGLMAAGRVADILSVRKGVEGVVTDQELTGMVDSAIGPHFEYHAEELRKAWARTKLATVCRQQADKLQDGDLDESLREIQNAISDIQDRATDIHPRHVTEFRADKIEQWRSARGRGFIGIPSCYPSLNKYMGGYRRQVTTILGGFRGEGKSTISRQEALSIAKAGFKVLVISMEDPADVAAAGIAGNESSVSVYGLDVGFASDFLRDKIDESWKKLADLPLWILSAGLTIDQIESAASIHKARHGLDFLVVDHLQFISPYELPRVGRNGTMALYSQRISNLAKRLDIAILALSQLSRESEKEKRKPRLSDLRDSGALEQDARAALLLYYINESNPDNSHHVIEVAKNNYGPSHKDINVKRIDGEQRFDEMDAPPDSTGKTEEFNP